MATSVNNAKHNLISIWRSLEESVVQTTTHTHARENHIALIKM